MDEANWLTTIFAPPFAKGLIIGFLFPLVIIIRGYLSRRDLKKEIANLRSSCTQNLKLIPQKTNNAKRKLRR